MAVDVKQSTLYWCKRWRGGKWSVWLPWI